MSSPINNTIYDNSPYLFQKCNFTAWFGTQIYFLLWKNQKDITHVKLLPSLAEKFRTFANVNVICIRLRNSAYVLSKLILKLSQVF